MRVSRLKTAFVLATTLAVLLSTGVFVTSALHVGGKNFTVRVYSNTNLSVPNNLWTPLSFNSERWDTNLYHSGSSSQLVAQGDAPNGFSVLGTGTYIATCNIVFAGNSTGNRGVAISKNGTFVAIQSAPNNGANTVSIAVATTVDLPTVGDWIDCRAYQNSGGSLNVNSNAQYSPEFAMTMVGHSTANPKNTPAAAPQPEPQEPGAK